MPAPAASSGRPPLPNAPGKRRAAGPAPKAAPRQRPRSAKRAGSGSGFLKTKRKPVDPSRPVLRANAPPAAPAGLLSTTPAPRPPPSVSNELLKQIMDDQGVPRARSAGSSARAAGRRDPPAPAAAPTASLDTIASEAGLGLREGKARLGLTRPRDRRAGATLLTDLAIPSAPSLPPASAHPSLAAPPPGPAPGSVRRTTLQSLAQEVGRYTLVARDGRARPSLHPSLTQRIRSERDVVGVDVVPADTFLREAERPEFAGFKCPRREAAPDYGEQKRRNIQAAMRHDDDVTELRKGLDDSIPPGVRTGEDAVVFFMKGNTKPGLMLFANFCKGTGPEDDNYQPFDLEVVPRSRVDPTHYVITATGISMVHDDRSDAGETQQLPEWLQDRQVFKMIRRMAFFRLFRLVRAFKQWRLNTRVLKHTHARNRLRDNLLLVAPRYQPALMEAVGVCAEIQADRRSYRWVKRRDGLWHRQPVRTWVPDDCQGDVRWRPGADRLGVQGLLSAIDANEVPQSLDLIVDRRVDAVAKAGEAVAELVGRVKAALVPAGEEVFRDVADARPKVPTQAEQMQGKLVARPGTLEHWRDKSMYARRTAAAESRSREARAEHQAHLMGRLVRLVDYLLAESIAGAARAASEAFSEGLSKTRSLFLVEGRCEVDLAKVDSEDDEVGYEEIKELRKQIFVQQGGSQAKAKQVVADAEEQRARIQRVALRLVPAEREVADAAAVMIAAIGEVMSASPRLALEAEVQPFLASAGCAPRKLISVERIIQLTTDVPALVARVASRLRKDFAVSLREEGGLAPFFGESEERLLWTFGWRESEYRELAQDPDVFVEDLTDMADWNARVRRAPSTVQQGLLLVDAEGVSARVRGEVGRVVDDMTAMVVGMVAKGCARLQALCQAACTALEARPTQLGEFAGFIESMAPHYSEAGNGVREIEDGAEALRKLANMFHGGGHAAAARSRLPGPGADAGKEDGMDEEAERTRAVIDSMPPAVQTIWDQAQRSLVEYHVARTQAREYVESFRTLAVNSLLQTGLSQEREITLFVDTVRSGTLVSATTSTAVAARELATLSQRLAELKQGAEKLVSFQSTFQISELGYLHRVLEAAVKSLHQVQAIWMAVSRWEEVNRELHASALDGHNPLPEPQAVEKALGDLVAVLEPRAQAPVTEDSLDMGGATRRERAQAASMLRRVSWWRDSLVVLSEICHPAVKNRHRRWLIQGIAHSLDFLHRIREARRDHPEDHGADAFLPPPPPPTMSQVEALEADRSEHSLRRGPPEAPRASEPGQAPATPPVPRLDSQRGLFAADAGEARPAEAADGAGAEEPAAEGAGAEKDGAEDGGSPGKPEGADELRDLKLWDPFVAHEGESRRSVVAVLMACSRDFTVRRVVHDMYKMATREGELLDELSAITEEWTALKLVFRRSEELKFDIVHNIVELSPMMKGIARRFEALAMSPYISGVQERYGRLERQFQAVRYVMEEVEGFQGELLSLSRVLMVPEIKARFGDSSSEIAECVTQWRNMVQMAREHPDISHCCAVNGALGRVGVLAKRVSQIKAFTMGLLVQLVRADFPRLLFVDDANLLEAVSVGPYVSRLKMDILMQCFGCIQALESDSSGIKVGGVLDSAGQHITFEEPVVLSPTGTVATELKSVEQELSRTLKALITECMAEHAEEEAKEKAASAPGSAASSAAPSREPSHHEDALKPKRKRDYPTQVVFVAEHILWTDSIQNALVEGTRPGAAPGDLSSLIDVCNEQVEVLVEQGRDLCHSSARAISAVIEEEERAQTEILIKHHQTGGGRTSSKAPKPVGRTAMLAIRRKVRGRSLLLSTYATLILYYRDVISDLLKEWPVGPTSFAWVQRIRYFVEAERVVVRVAEMSVPYGFEFTGSHRDPILDLAPGPLSSVLAVASAVTNGHVLALSPDPRSGMLPAQVARAVTNVFGRVFYSMTCSSSMSHHATARALTACIESASWCCIDKVHDLRPEVLSQLAQQIHEVVTAWSQLNMETVSIRGGEIDLRDARERGAGGFQLMLGCPPTGARSTAHLDSMLQWLTRRMCITAPPFPVVVEAVLLSLGLPKGHEVARKLSTLSRLLDAHLSQESGYDFGHGLLIKLIPYLRERGATYQLRGLTAAHLVHDACLDTIFPRLSESDQEVALMVMEDVWGADGDEGEDGLMAPGDGTTVERVGSRSIKLDDLDEVGTGIATGVMTAVLRRAQKTCPAAMQDPELTQWLVMNVVTALTKSRAVVVVGQPGSGKSLVLSMAAELLSTVQAPIVTKIDHVFVDAIPYRSLFGSADTDLRDSEPSILARLTQQTAEEQYIENAAIRDAAIADDSRAVQRIVNFDASSTSLVLEDLAPLLANGLAHQPNGSMVRAAGPLAFAVEVESLAGLSPSTLSQIPVVSIAQPVFAPTVESLTRDIASRPVTFSQTMIRKAAEYVLDAVDWAHDHLLSVARMGPRHTSALRVMSLMQAVYSDLFRHVGVSAAGADQGITCSERLSGCCLLYALVWGVGGCLTPEETAQFEDRLRDRCPPGLCALPPAAVPLHHCAVDPVHVCLAPIPLAGHDTKAVQLSKKAAVEHAASVGEVLEFEDVFVHSAGTMAVLTAAVLSLKAFVHAPGANGPGGPGGPLGSGMRLRERFCPVILGPAVCGKTALAREVVAVTGQQLLLLPLTSMSTSTTLSATISSLMQRDRGQVLRPVLKSRAALVLDDLHLPLQACEGVRTGEVASDSRAAQALQALEFVRMILGTGGMLDPETGGLLRLAKVVCLGTASRSGLFYGSVGRGTRTLNHTVPLALHDLEACVGPRSLLLHMLEGPVFKGIADRRLAQTFGSLLNPNILGKLVDTLRSCFRDVCDSLLNPTAKVFAPVINMHRVVGAINGIGAVLDHEFSECRRHGLPRNMTNVSKLRISHLFVHETCLQVSSSQQNPAVSQHVRVAVVHAALHLVDFENHTLPVHADVGASEDLLRRLTTGADVQNGQLVEADGKFRSMLQGAFDFSMAQASGRGFTCPTTQFNWAGLSLTRLGWPGTQRLIARLLAIQRLGWGGCHAILAGSKGSGRHSAIRLAAAYVGGVVFDVTHSAGREVTSGDVLARVKEAVSLTITENRRVVLLVDVSAVPHEALHPALQLLASENLPPGMVPTFSGAALHGTAAEAVIRDMKRVIDHASEDVEVRKGKHGKAASQRRSAAPAVASEDDEDGLDVESLNIDLGIAESSPLIRAQLSAVMSKSVRQHLRVVFVVGAGEAHKLVAQAPLLGSQCVVQCVDKEQESLVTEALFPRMLDIKLHQEDGAITSLLRENGMKLEIEVIEEQFSTLAKAADAMDLARCASEIHHEAIRFFEEVESKVDLRPEITASHLMVLTGSYEKILKEQLLFMKEQYAMRALSRSEAAAMRLQLSVAEKALMGLEPKLEQAAADVTKSTTDLVDIRRQSDRLLTQVEGLRNSMTDVEEVVNGRMEEIQAEIRKRYRDFEVFTGKVANLKPDELHELKSYTTPPKMVRSVLLAWGLCHGYTGDKWESARDLFVSKISHRKLDSYSMDAVTPALVKRLQVYVTEREFRPEAVAQVSRVVRALAEWVLSVHDLALGMFQAKVSSGELKYKTSSMEHVRAVLDAKQAALDALAIEERARVAVLNKGEAQLANLKAARADVERSIKRTRRLMTALDQTAAGEDFHSASDERLLALEGDCLLMAAAVTYLPPLPHVLRASLLERWSAIMSERPVRHSRDFSLHEAVRHTSYRSTVLPQGVMLEGVERDNLIMANLTHRIPLLVDPTGQALAAIKVLRKGVYWYQFSSATPNVAHEVFTVLHDGGSVLLRLHGDPHEHRRLQRLVNMLRANERTARLMLGFPRVLIAHTDSLSPAVSELVGEAFTVVNCHPDRADVTERMLSEIMKIKSPAREAKHRETVNALHLTEAMEREKTQQLVSLLMVNRTKVWKSERIMEQVLDCCDQVLATRDQLLVLQSELLAARDFDRRDHDLAGVAAAAYCAAAALWSRVPSVYVDLPSFVDIFREANSIKTPPPDPNLDPRDRPRERLPERLYSPSPGRTVQSVYRALAPNGSREQASLLAMCMTVGLSIARGEIDPAEWEFLVAWLQLAFRDGARGRADEAADPAPVAASTGDVAAAVARLSRWVVRYPKPSLQNVGRKIAADLPGWERALSSRVPAENVPRPFDEKLTAFEKVVVLSILEPELVPGLCKWFAGRLFRAPPTVGPVDKIVEVASQTPMSVPIMMYVGSEIGAVPLVQAANVDFEQRAVKGEFEEEAFPPRGRGGPAGPGGASVAGGSVAGSALGAVPSTQRRMKTPGRGVTVHCAGEESRMTLGATLTDARKHGKWVVVVNAGLEPDMMLSLFASLDLTGSTSTHPNFRVFVVLSSDSDRGVKWAVTARAYTLHLQLLQNPNRDIATLLHVWEAQAPRMMNSVSVANVHVRRVLLSAIAAHASVSWELTSSHFSTVVSTTSRAWVPTVWDLHRAVHVLQTIAGSLILNDSPMSEFVQWCAYGTLPRRFISRHALLRTFEFFNLDGEKEPKTFIARAIAQAGQKNWVKVREGAAAEAPKELSRDAEKIARKKGARATELPHQQNLPRVLELIDAALPAELTWPMALGNAHRPHHLGDFATSLALTDHARLFAVTAHVVEEAWLAEMAQSTGRVMLRHSGSAMGQWRNPLSYALGTIARLQRHLRALKRAAETLEDVQEALTEESDDPLQVILGPGLSVEHLVVLEASMLGAAIERAVQDMTAVHVVLAGGSECASPITGRLVADALVWPLPNCAGITHTGDWVEEVCRRALYLRGLLDRAVPESQVPKWRSARPHDCAVSVVDLSAWCRPEGLVTAMQIFLHESADDVPAVGALDALPRAHVTPYASEDDLPPDEVRPDGVYVAGAYMQGGVWDEERGQVLPHPTGSCLPLLFVSLEGYRELPSARTADPAQWRDAPIATQKSGGIAFGMRKASLESPGVRRAPSLLGQGSPAGGPLERRASVAFREPGGGASGLAGRPSRGGDAPGGAPERVFRRRISSGVALARGALESSDSDSEASLEEPPFAGRRGAPGGRGAPAPRPSDPRPARAPPGREDSLHDLSASALDPADPAAAGRAADLDRRGRPSGDGRGYRPVPSGSAGGSDGGSAPPDGREVLRRIRRDPVPSEFWTPHGAFGEESGSPAGGGAGSRGGGFTTLVPVFALPGLGAPALRGNAVLAVACTAAPWLDSLIGTASAVLAPPLAGPEEQAGRLEQAGRAAGAGAGEEPEGPPSPEPRAGPGSPGSPSPAPAGGEELPGVPARPVRQRIHSVLGVASASVRMQGVRARTPSEMLISLPSGGEEGGRVSPGPAGLSPAVRRALSRAADDARQRVASRNRLGSSSTLGRRDSQLPFGVQDVLRGDFG